MTYTDIKRRRMVKTMKCNALKRFFNINHLDKQSGKSYASTSCNIAIYEA